MARKKRGRKRIEFILDGNSQRDLEIWDHLDRLARHGDAGEFIRAACYAALHPQPVSNPDDEIIERLERIEQAMSKLKAGAVLPEPEQNQDDPRIARAKNALLNLNFGELDN